MPSRTRTALPGLCGLALALGGCSNPPEPAFERWPTEPTPWVAVWRDDFDGAAQGAPDPAHWNLEIRPSGQNQELDYDTDERKNSFLDGNGNLVLKAYQEQYVDAAGVQSNQPYTSARINTRGKVEQAYGRYEARIKLPPGGPGIWPAFWLLGADIQDTGWPACGEVDILEMGGSEPHLIDGSLHGPGYSGGNAYHHYYEVPGKFSDDFHTFTFEWTQTAVRWLVDGNEYYVKTKAGVEGSGQRWVYDHAFYIIVNLAVGGIYDGDPDSSTVFPQEMVIDYVSVEGIAGPGSR